jgi:undecaprenyl-diphosphatase
VRSQRVSPQEESAFRAINDLPDAVFPPVYVVMQCGNLAAVFVTGAIEAATGHRRRAVVTVAAGTGVWGACKLVKPLIGRGRPSAELDNVHERGPVERGLGFPSGHTAVATTLAVLLAPTLPRPLRLVPYVIAACVGGARIYVGAHLPLDVVGGAAIGFATGSVARKLSSPSS